MAVKRIKPTEKEAVRSLQCSQSFLDQGPGQLASYVTQVQVLGQAPRGLGGFKLSFSLAIGFHSQLIAMASSGSGWFLRSSRRHLRIHSVGLILDEPEGGFATQRLLESFLKPQKLTTPLQATPLMLTTPISLATPLLPTTPIR